MSFDSAFLPFTVFFDWLRYFDREGGSHELKPLLLHKIPGGLTKGYLNDTEYCKAAEEGLLAYIKDDKYLLSVQSRYDKLVSEIEEGYLEVFSKQKNFEESELFDLVNKLHRLLVDLVKITFPTERLDKTIIARILKGSVDLEKIWKISELITFESFETRNNKYIFSVLDGGKEIDLLRYVYTGYTVLPTREDVLSAVSKIDREDVKKHMVLSQEGIDRNKKARQVEITSLNEGEAKILRYIDWVMEMRDHRKAYISKSEIALAELGRRLFKIWGLDSGLVNYMSILELVRGKEYVGTIIEKIKARTGDTYTVLYLGEGKEIEQSTEDLADSIKLLEEIVIKQHSSSETTEIKGETASRGMVRGRIKIVLAVNEFSEFNSGDILVAPMTRPEYVPLMRKASAIITDEGGITCHAAIVSRELKIPCIIGTKIATKVLKDGDMVEVDANRGIIKKI